MDEEGGELRVARQDQSSLERGLGCGSLEGGLVRARREVHRVVGGQLFGGSRGGGDSCCGFAGRGGFAGARVGRGLGHDGGVARDREGHFAARVVVGLAVEVDACGADLDAGGDRVRAVGQEGGEVYVLRGHAQLGVAVFAGAVTVDAGQGRHVHVQVADRRGGGRVEGDGACGQGRSVEALPFALADPVFEGRDGRLHLVTAHGGQRVDEAVAAVFLAVGGHLQARVVDGRLLAHEVDDLPARERGVRGLDERGDARDVRGRHGGAARLSVSARILGGWDGGVDAVAGCREVNGGAVVGEVRAREGRPLGLGLLVDALESAHLADTRHLAGNADGSRDRTILDGRVHVGRRAGVSHRMVVVRILVACRGDDGQSLALRVGDGAQRGLEARRLLWIGRTPVDPRVHRIRVVHDVHAVAGRPHERARHVLGVDELLGVGGLDRHEGRIRRDAVDADPVVVRRDNAGDVRAVEVVVTPAPVCLGGDAVGRT